jgi:hypothetical protein
MNLLSCRCRCTRVIGDVLITTRPLLLLPPSLPPSPSPVNSRSLHLFWSATPSPMAGPPPPPPRAQPVLTAATASSTRLRRCRYEIGPPPPPPPRPGPILPAAAMSSAHLRPYRREIGPPPPEAASAVHLHRQHRELGRGSRELDAPPTPLQARPSSAAATASTSATTGSAWRRRCGDRRQRWARRGGGE